MTVNKVAIVGVGLIGGSLAAAWRQAGFAGHIVGIEADTLAAGEATAAGLVDELADGVPPDAELVAICTASDQIAACVAELAGHAGVIFDVGSVKAAIVDELMNQHGGVPPQFVPAHPIAGSEQSGPGAARADLFRDATTVITPLQNTKPAAIALVRAAWQAVGAQVEQMTPAEHDEMLAVTSHLPHLLAFTYMQQVRADQIPFSGGGFRDFTRIAGAHPELWWRILRLNRNQVLAAAEQFNADLQHFMSVLAADDRQAGVQLLKDAANLRQRLDRAMNDTSTVAVITIDGPSGSGKGTLARAVAERLGWHLLDSGALYRIVGVMCLERGVDFDDETAVAALAGALDIRFENDGVWVDGVDKADVIRTEDAGVNASRVAHWPEVRNAVLALQRAFRKSPGLVADGRDMGTVVFPDAQLKFFLDASAEERAQRRYKQLKNKGLSVSLPGLLAQIQERDARDRGRAVAPLIPADDAMVIDSTSMSIEDVLERVMTEAKSLGL
jgi:CMP/dCMP kinase